MKFLCIARNDNAPPTFYRIDRSLEVIRASVVQFGPCPFAKVAVVRKNGSSEEVLRAEASSSERVFPVAVPFHEGEEIGVPLTRGVVVEFETRFVEEVPVEAAPASNPRRSPRLTALAVPVPPRATAQRKKPSRRGRPRGLGRKTIRRRIRQELRRRWARQEAGDCLLQNMSYRNLATITALLNSAHVHVRVAAGTVLALMYEIAREETAISKETTSKGFATTFVPWPAMAKGTGTRERRMQRASFRQIERSVRDGDQLCIEVRFEEETMWIESWKHKLIYETLCRFLSSGMNLSQNPVIRRLLDLGAPKRIKRAREHKAEPAEIKQRTKLMAELRLKRMETGPDMDA